MESIWPFVLWSLKNDFPALRLNLFFSPQLGTTATHWAEKGRHLLERFDARAVYLPRLLARDLEHQQATKSWNPASVPQLGWRKSLSLQSRLDAQLTKSCTEFAIFFFNHLERKRGGETVRMGINGEIIKPSQVGSYQTSLPPPLTLTPDSLAVFSCARKQ